MISQEHVHSIQDSPNTRCCSGLLLLLLQLMSVLLLLLLVVLLLLLMMVMMVMIGAPQRRVNERTNEGFNHRQVSLSESSFQLGKCYNTVMFAETGAGCVFIRVAAAGMMRMRLR